MKFKFSWNIFELFLTEFYKNTTNVYSLFGHTYKHVSADRHTTGLRVGFSLFIGKNPWNDKPFIEKNVSTWDWQINTQSMKFNTHVIKRVIWYLT